jgi:hypothetical protein
MRLLTPSVADYRDTSLEDGGERFTGEVGFVAF